MAAATLWGRFMNGLRTGVAAFNERYYIPHEDYGWDTYTARLNRYAFAEWYYNNTVYTRILGGAAELHRYERRLYKHVQGVYNPVKRLVDSYPAKIYGGQIDWMNLERGAIPVVSASETRIRDGVKALWRASNIGQVKSLYVHYGALYGDSVLKVVDDRASEKVRLEVVHPAKIKDITLNSAGDITRVVIEYNRTDDQPAPVGNAQWDESGGKSYVYTEVIDEQSFRTYKDGEPFAFYEDADGNKVSAWTNEYGFVPLVMVKHRNMGLDYGANAFYGSTRKIDILNDAASLLNDAIRKSVRIVWFFSGVNSANSTVTMSDEEKDQLPAIFAPVGAEKPFAMTPNLDLQSALANVAALSSEVEKDMPELALNSVRERVRDVTGAAIESLYQDAVERYVEAQGHYDDGLVRANRMALAIGGYNRYKGYEGFTLESRNDDSTEHQIAKRKYMFDKVSEMERLNILIAAGASKEFLMQELDYAQDVIDEELARMPVNDPNATMDELQSSFNGGQVPPSPTPSNLPGVTSDRPATNAA